MSGWSRYRDDAPVNEPAVTLDAFLAQPDARAVVIEAGDDVRALVPRFEDLTLVVVAMRSFRDGRAYSSARILRELGYSGELRAEGDILIDQLHFLRRCGFDSFAPDSAIDAAAAEAAMGRFPHVYQKAADAAPPIWALRHG